MRLRLLLLLFHKILSYYWHKYFCFAGYEDDVIKLYDLTTLCSHLVDDVTTNPFTVPVGILLYRVARNMRMHGRQKSNVVRSLLEKCLLLLDAVKHAQVINHLAVYCFPALTAR